MVEISIYLFSKPEAEIDLGKAEPEDFRRLGNELQKRLARAAEIIEKLESNGWERSEGIYDLNFYKKVKLKEAEKELEKLGIQRSEIGIIEDNYENEDMED